VEIKNLNSSRFVRLGLNYEIARQGEMLDAGKTVVQETRLWNENRDQTEPMRQKENAQDYRFFPEPDLPVFSPDLRFLKIVDDSLVELPQNRIARFKRDYGLSDEHAELICEEKSEADYFEEAVAETQRRGVSKEEAAKGINRLLLSDIRHLMAKGGYGAAALMSPGSNTVDEKKRFPLTASRLALIAAFTIQGKLSGKNAKQCLEAVIGEDRDPEAIIRERGWESLSDSGEIGKAAEAVYAAEQKVFDEVRESIASGTEKRRRSLSAYLTGKVIAATGGRADPKIAAEKIEELIAKM
jgi:aspartyl-tRNA(Asn)/glutamyl-tRNA(Gln) amidotransferase subunit B